MDKPGILLVGSFLSKSRGTKSVGEELSILLDSSGWHTIKTSEKQARSARLMDMMLVTLRRKTEYDVAYVEVYSGLSFMWAEIVVSLLSILRKPVVLALHGGGLLDFANTHNARMARLLSKGRKVVTPSMYLKTGLNKITPYIEYLPNGIDINSYRFCLRDNPTPNIVWLRAFHSIYQPELAVRALFHLVKDFEHAHLTMIGQDKQDGSLKSVIRLADEIGIRSHITLTGPIAKSAVPGKLAEADVFLNTTRYESFGISVVEAAASGLPIVTTNVGELPFLWKNEKTAMLVPSDDPEAMAYAMKRVLTETALAKSLSQNARQRVEEFDWSVVMPRWEKIFQEVLEA